MKKGLHRHFEKFSPNQEVLSGRQPVREALRAGRRKVYRMLIAEGVKNTSEIRELLQLAEERRIPIIRTHGGGRQGRLSTAEHQGVAAEVSPYPYLDFDSGILDPVAQKDGEALVLILDHIQDPHNLGALVRTAETAGVDGVVIPRDRAAGVTPAVVRASAGAVEHEQVALVSNIVFALNMLKNKGLRIVGLEAVEEAELYTEADLTGSCALVVGSEGEGLGRLVREACDTLIRLPIHGHVTSLNASVAGAIALYEIRRQQGADRRVTRRSGCGSGLLRE